MAAVAVAVMAVDVVVAVVVVTVAAVVAAIATTIVSSANRAGKLFGAAPPTLPPLSIPVLICVPLISEYS